MSEEAEGAPAAGGAAPTSRAEIRAFVELYAVHAAHAFEYCRALAGRDATAASATGAALAHVWRVPPMSHLRRAMLIAAARQQAMAAAEPGQVTEFGVGRLEASYGPAAGALRDLPSGYREVLVLVYRHGVWPEQLGAVLGLPSKDAYERLAAAEHDFMVLAAALEPAGPLALTGAAGEPASTPAGGRASLDAMGALPFAAVPGSVWRSALGEFTADTGLLATRPRRPRAAVTAAAAAATTTDDARQPGVRPRRLRIAVAAALPVAAIGCWAILAGLGPGHPVAARGAAEPAATRSRAARTPGHADTRPARKAAAPVPPATSPSVPILALLPSTPAGTVLPIVTPKPADPKASPSPASSPSASAAPSPSGSPSPSSSPSPSGSPSPSQSPSLADPVSPAASSTSDPASSAAPSASGTGSPAPTASGSASVPDPSPAG